jgi:thiamine biosynthesis lipoprotein
MLRLEFHAMGCQLLVATENESLYAEQRLNQVPSLFADWEQTLSRFRPESELNQLNNQPGKLIPVSQVLWDVMQTAKFAWQKSDGLITPTVLPMLESTGYTETFERIAGGVGASPITTQQYVSSFEQIEFDENTRALRIPPGMRLDLGGIAKGWAAHQAMLQLRYLGPVLVDSGGDIAINAPLANGEAWEVGVNNPFDRGQNFEKLFVQEGGIATSGRDHRRWQQGAEQRHHVIDPRTGRPAETDLLSVTVIAEDVMNAEMAAKKVLILGSEEGLAWLDDLENASGLAVLENGESLGSHGIEKYLRS